MVVVVELMILPILHPGETAGSRVPVLSHLIPWRLILTHETTPVGVADGAVEGQGEAGDDDPEDGRPQRQRGERGARRPGSGELEENAEDDAENNTGNKRAEDEGALPTGFFSGLHISMKGGRLLGGHCRVFGNLFQENLRAGSDWGTAGGGMPTSSSAHPFRPYPALLRLPVTHRRYEGIENGPLRPDVFHEPEDCRSWGFPPSPSAYPAASPCIDNPLEGNLFSAMLFRMKLLQHGV